MGEQKAHVCFCTCRTVDRGSVVAVFRGENPTQAILEHHAADVTSAARALEFSYPLGRERPSTVTVKKTSSRSSP